MTTQQRDVGARVVGGDVVADDGLPAVATADVWDLHARVDLVGAAADRWQVVAAAVRTAADDVNTPAQALAAEWDGPAADSFDAHRRRLIGDLDRAADLAGTVAAGVDRVARTLQATQSHLTDEWARVATVEFRYDQPMHLVFQPATPAEQALVLDSIGQCERLRGQLDQQLTADLATLEQARAQFGQLATTWLAVADGRAEPFLLPAEAATTGVIYDGKEVVVNTGIGDDQVRIGVDPVTGMQVVTVNGTRYYFPVDAPVVVRGGVGDDTITVAPGTRLHLTLIGSGGNDVLQGGDGDDTILGLTGHDRLYGGAGADRLDGGADRDYLEGNAGDDILDGGRGDDTVYGMDGNDAITGGEGQDYLEGATGNDTLDGGAGNDILSGGTGDDTLRGAGGNDVFYAGRGHDGSDGGLGADKAFSETGDTSVGVEQNVTVQIKDLGAAIHVQGSPEFKARVEADLEFLRSSPDGQQMLATFDRGHAAGHELTIVEYQDPRNPDNSATQPVGDDALILYNPHLDDIRPNDGSTLLEGPPVAVLYHEMAHADDIMNDTFAPGVYTGADDLGRDGQGVPNLEREAAGLPIDGDNNPATPPQLYDRHPYQLTENGLRDEMGAPHREAY